MKCDICDVELIEGNPGNFYGTLKGKNYISRHHFFPKRFIKIFTKGEVKKKFGIENLEGKACLCYECHEEMVHNLILNKKMVEQLKPKMINKNIKERIEIFYNIFKSGLNGN